MFDFQKEITELIREKIYSCLNLNHRRNQSDKVNVRCFICGDSKKDTNTKRGWIHFNVGDVPSYFCWNENCKAHGITLLAKIQGITNKQAFAQVVQRFRESGSDLDFSGDDFIIDDDNFEEFNTKPKLVEREEFIIPEDWMELDKRAANIIDNRKIMEAPFAPKNWKLYLSAKYTRIVIPWTKDGKIIGHQLRSIYKTQLPKYKFEKGTEKPIFGLNNINYEHNKVYFIEGVFDSVFCANGLAIGGIKLTNHQQEVMDNYMLEHVYLLDNQWVDEASKRETLLLLKANKNVFIWPKSFKAKDINEHVVATGKNPFTDFKFLEKHTYTGLKGILRFKFNK